MTLTQDPPKIIIVPSPLIRAETYFRLRDHLQKFGRAAVLELSETGNYGSMKKVWYPEDYARWISEYLKERHLKDLVLLGHSNSGPIVTQVARMIPDRIQGLILADSIGAQTQRPLRVLRGRLWDALLEFKFSLRALPHLMKNAIAHPRNFFLQVSLSHKQMDEKLFSETNPHPVFLAWGARDHTMPTVNLTTWQEQCGSCHLYVSPSGSHDWILTRPQELADALASWAVLKLVPPSHESSAQVSTKELSPGSALSPSLSEGPL